MPSPAKERPCSVGTLKAGGKGIVAAKQLRPSKHITFTYLDVLSLVLSKVILVLKIT